MNTKTLDQFDREFSIFEQLVRRGLRQHDPSLFGQLSDPAMRETRKLAMTIIRVVIVEVLRALPDPSIVTALWKMRGMLAPLAQALHKAMRDMVDPIVDVRREAVTDARGPGLGPTVAENKMRASMDAAMSRAGRGAAKRRANGRSFGGDEQIVVKATDGARAEPGAQTVKDQVLEMVLKHLDKATAGKLPPAFRKALSFVVAAEAAELPSGFDVVALVRAVRRELADAAVFLQRASACLWTMAMLKEREAAEMPSLAGNTAMKKPTEKSAMTDAAYYSALKEFANKIASLNVDPESVPVGEEAVEEALSICAVRQFLQRRYRELRRWVHPQAFVSSAWASYAEIGADRGEQLILASKDGNPESADATNPRAWTWQDQDDADYVIGDLLTYLHQSADVLGMDWDEAKELGEWHYDEERKEEEEEKCTAPAS